MDASSNSATPPAVVALVQRFAQNEDFYRGPSYNEALCRVDFISPMFAELGWDLANVAGYADAYRDVIHEDSLKIGAATSAPDYSFRIGGARKFFLEAKKPGVNLKTAPEPAFQLRRYAWSAKLPLSILTDFEEFAVYDCRVKPSHTDKPSVARILYLTYDQYPEKWGEIAAIFSKEAILKGSFDKYAQTVRGKRGTAEVDNAFLAEIEEWRETLARNFALRNAALSVRDLNYAVQRTIDRVIFLRMCEDRGIERYGRLQELVQGTGLYARLGALFREADDKYNAGLFYFSQEPDRGPPDALTLGLKLDDKVLKDIVGRLYYPESPYEFSVLSADILGQVYEQFLGKVIRLTAGHRAVIEEKPEVRKAGGVYYTPTYIVDYIVKHTVGKLLEGRTPREIGPDRETKAGRARKLPKGAKMLRVLDPACGSGSFLLGAYQYLLDWHREQYVGQIVAGKPLPAGLGERIYQGAGGVRRLTIREKKRILLNNIYGVDIDPQAVEVTKLSLLLKVLEGETDETVGSSLRLFHERALPDLTNNIKCGNALIGPDFYNGQQFEMFDEEERYRINAFDWKAEFAEAFKEGGFDALIGNPPYGASFSASEQQYLRARLQSYHARGDSYVAFLEAGIKRLRDGGTLGMIIPSAIFGGPAYFPVRELLLQWTQWERAILLPYDVFAAAYIDTAIVCLRRVAEASTDHVALTYEYPKRERITSMDDITYTRVPQHTWLADPEKRIVMDPSAVELIATLRIRCSLTLGDIIEVRRGVLPTPEALSPRKTRRHAYPYFEGDVYRYRLNECIKRYAALDESMKERPRDFKWFSGSRLLLRRLVNRQFRLMATSASETFITNKNLYSLLPMSVPHELVLGVLNSRLLSHLYVKLVTQATKDDFAQVTIKDLCSLPWPGAIPSADEKRMVTSVRRMLALQRRSAAATATHEHTVIQREIDQTDREIDRLVYELYGLTDEEIAVVEEAIAAPGDRGS
ncbi:MAG: N-6 DNA methylase [Phycisphaerales bacterium]|nr:N-6 DNA methylase [Phycisphaerales bacterium]